MIKDLLIQILKKTQEREQLITRLISRLDPDAYQGYENQEPASIARKVYDTKTKEANEIIQQIMKNSRLHSTRLHVGQVLMIPQAEYNATADEGFKIYHVRRGDNPFYIAKRHSMEIERFLRINRLTPKSKIFPGQRLFVE